ncbi:hypothetical protein HOD41_09130 [bacterium]|jgi:hypothetical protein|nr:hypothetical protein [bacterium]
MAQKFIAFVTAATGFWFIVSRWPDYQHAYQLLIDTVPIAGFYIAALTGMMMLIPVLKIVAGIGLWRLCRWSLYLALIVLSVDFVTLATAVVRFHSAASNVPFVSELELSGAVNVEVHSLWPTYTVAVLSALSLLVLALKLSKRQAEE